jgi:oligopeptide/dipeptide ABC transporter ATP-binding protein
MSPLPLLEVDGLEVRYRRGRHQPPLRAVLEASLQIQPGETVGLVGESGSGKSTIGNAVLGLVPIHAGRVVFAGEDITAAGPRRRRELSADLQVIFQDPYSSLNPSRTIGQTLAEPLLAHGIRSRAQISERIDTMLAKVGLPPDTAERYPTQFSGGQRQRIAIARALMLQPKLVVCDEPVSALDLSVQAQVLNLLRDLQRELGLSYLFISHDLDIVRHLCHRVLVMYRGHIVETGPAEQINNSPAHPYTQALLTAAPVPNTGEQEQRRKARRAAHVSTAGGEIPEAGCPFVPRCPHAMPVCSSRRPALVTTAVGAAAACHWSAPVASADQTVSASRLSPAGTSPSAQQERHQL